MNNRYIAIFAALIVVVGGIIYFTYPKKVNVPVTPIESPVEEATSTPEVSPTSTSTATTTTPASKPIIKIVASSTVVATPPSPKTYTLAEISTHNSKTSCWTAVNAKVYDITTYIPKHPGGEKQIMQVCGKDGTYLFEDQHSGDKKPNATIAKFMIGDLAK